MAPLDSWKYRNYLGHMGLLFYCLAPLRTQPSSMPSNTREVSTKLREQPYPLDMPIAIKPSALTQLLNWTKEALRNDPAEVKTDGGKPTNVIVTDASKWGWGAVYLQVDSGRVLTFDALAFFPLNGVSHLCPNVSRITVLSRWSFKKESSLGTGKRKEQKGVLLEGFPAPGDTAPIARAACNCTPRQCMSTRNSTRNSRRNSMRDETTI
jgi:hypothetical protein